MDRADGLKKMLQPLEKGLLFKLTALAVALALIVLGAGIAFAAELVTAELEGVSNEVTVTQGTTQAFDISVSATGKIQCGKTATATVDTVYELTKTGTANPVMTTSAPSSAITFSTVEGSGSNICDVTWPGAPSPIKVAATMSVGSNVPVADYTQLLAPTAGTTTVDNSAITTNGDSGKLLDGTSTTLKFKVTAPAAPANTAPSIAATSASVTVNEGTQASNSGTWSDNGDVTLTASLGSVTKNPNGNAGTWSWSHTPGNETTSTGDTITITATDGGSLSTNTTFKLIANNVAPTTPGTPTVPSALSNSGAYTVSWNASSDVSADTITYTVEHKNGSADWSSVATGLTGASYTFGGTNANEGEGSWKYRVKATDGTDTSAYSQESNAVLVDNTAPSITVSATDENGDELAVGEWTNTDVTVTFTCVDADSGPASSVNLTGGGTFSTSGTAQAGGTCVDNAGNAAETFPSFVVKIDRQRPTIVATATTADGEQYSGGWTNQNVTVTFTCTDEENGSGVATDELTGDGTLSASGTKQSAGTCTDNAGNSANSFPSVTAQIETDAPTITSAAITADGETHNGGWTNQAVTVTFTCTDEEGGSGVDGDNSNVGGGNTFTTSGTAQSTGTCVDNAGNAATTFPSVDVQIDTQDPTIEATATRGAEGAAYESGTWTNQNVTVSYRCGDEGGSQLATACPSTEAVTSSTPSAGVNKSASITDNAGNQTTSNVINVKVDKAAPTVTCPAAPTYQLNATGPLAVTATVTDALSGAATATASGAVDTSRLGTFTTDVIGFDNAGNSHTAACEYHVKAAFTGWSSPINNPNFLNKMKAGQAVPFKWRLTDAKGVGISTLTSSDVKISVGGLGCASSAPVDGVEEYATGSSGLQNLGDGYYQVNWKSLSGYAGSCRKVTFDITGASQQSADFQLTK